MGDRRVNFAKDRKSIMTASIVGWAHTPFGKFDAETVESLVVRAANEALADYSRSGGSTGGDDGTGEPVDASCYSATLQRQMPENSCVQSRFDGLWYQCSEGQWGDRYSNPDACVSQHPL